MEERKKKESLGWILSMSFKLGGLIYIYIYIYFFFFFFFLFFFFTNAAVMIKENTVKV